MHFLIFIVSVWERTTYSSSSIIHRRSCEKERKKYAPSNHQSAIWEENWSGVQEMEERVHEMFEENNRLLERIIGKSRLYRTSLGNY